MKLVKGLLLGSAAALVSVGSAQAADLPTHKAAPVEYVRICDAYGAGFFYIPGTETCLKIGGMVLGEFRGFNPSYQISGSGFYGQGAQRARTVNGFVFNGYGPSAGQYTNHRERDATHFNALGRVELDARNATPWGTLRAFLRVDSYWGSGGNSSTGNLGGIAFNTTASNRQARESTIINKAFIQFAGLTAGRAQSMFDFYADAYNFAGLRGSNATVGLLSYTATFGGGFSATLSFEDQASRRAAVLSTLASLPGADPLLINGIAGTSFQGNPGGARVPDIVANLRYDDKWGSVQVSAAAHQVNASLFSSTATANSPTTYAYPALTSNSYGFAVQGGINLKMDYLAPGDQLWLQAAYEKGAYGYIAGNNLGFNYNAVNANRFYGAGFTPMDYSYGWDPQINADCVWTGSFSCEKQWGWDVTGAFRHYWIPTLSSSLFGSYQEVHYSGNALAGFGGAVGVANLKESRVGTNLVWTPIKGFNIGTEFMYIRLEQTRPVGLATDYGVGSLSAAGLPTFRPIQSEYEGRLRVQRSF
jgi:hypothetical protein